MAFNVDKLFKFCFEEIKLLAKAHQDETFYGFAIDASLLCLNSVEEFEKNLKKYQKREARLMRYIEKWSDITQEDLIWNGGYFQLGAKNLEEFRNLDEKIKEDYLLDINVKNKRRKEKGNYYQIESNILDLRENTGDWAYQGFAEMTGKHGFDKEAYNRHYGMSDERQKTSAYGKAMDELLQKLKESNLFKDLKKTDDFYTIRVEHNY